MTIEQAVAHQNRLKAPIGSPVQQGAVQLKPTSRSKYGSCVTLVDGIRFHSKLESERYLELKLLATAGLISGLELQPRFALRVDGELIATLVADFAYHDGAGNKVVEDTKGFRTREFIMKSKLFAVLYRPLKITEVRKHA